jgi:hypothetical protein
LLASVERRRGKRQAPEQTFLEALEAHKRMRAAETPPEAEDEDEIEAEPATESSA